MLMGLSRNTVASALAGDVCRVIGVAGGLISQ
jgi:hypothetical protein